MVLHLQVKESKGLPARDPSSVSSPTADISCVRGSQCLHLDLKPLRRVLAEPHGVGLLQSYLINSTTLLRLLRLSVDPFPNSQTWS